MIQTPVLHPIQTYSALKSKDFEFFYRGSVQITQNNLVIRRTSDNSIVYDETINTFQHKHTVDANTLVNGTEYMARIRVGDINNNWSDFSDWIVFYCYSEPILTITSIIDGVINNQNPLITATYEQAEGDQLQSYRFLLYDNLDNLLITYNEKYGLPIEQQIENLQNNKVYKIELRTLSVHGMQFSSGLIPFVAQYIEPKFASAVNLRNLKDRASIEVACHLMQIIGEVGSGSISYEDNDWINLLNGYVYFQEGFYVENDFTLKLWCKQIPVNSVFLKMIGRRGNIILKYQDDEIHLYKYVYDTVPYHIFSQKIYPTNDDVVYICIQHKDNYCNVFAKVVD